MKRVLVVGAVFGSFVIQKRFTVRRGPGDRRHFLQWNRCYPEITQDRFRDMYHCYYPYLFEHGDKMSLYPKIPSNPREWQPGQLLATYDAIREDKYDAFLRLREKFPELYQDTRAWDNPPPFGEFNQFYSVRFGMVGVKVFTTNEYDCHGNQMDMTAFWFPDNQIVGHKTFEKHGRNRVVVGAMNVPAEFHKPYVAAFYKSARVPVKHVCTEFNVTPDAFAPVGTKLDVRHFKVGQEVDVSFQYTDFGFQGVLFRHGFDGGPVWLGDSKWQRRPGSLGSEGQKRIYPGHRMAGQTGAHISTKFGVPIYRIDYKNSLVYLPALFESDIGVYVRMCDTLNTFGKTTWSAHRGYPPFPTFIAEEGEDLSSMSTEDCQIVSAPLFHYFRDEHPAVSQITQADVDDAKSANAAVAPPKRRMPNTKKFYEARKKHRQALRRARRWKLAGLRERAAKLQEDARRAKILKYKRTK